MEAAFERPPMLPVLWGMPRMRRRATTPLTHSVIEVVRVHTLGARTGALSRLIRVRDGGWVPIDARVPTLPQIWPVCLNVLNFILSETDAMRSGNSPAPFLIVKSAPASSSALATSVLLNRQDICSGVFPGPKVKVERAAVSDGRRGRQAGKGSCKQGVQCAVDWDLLESSDWTVLERAGWKVVVDEMRHGQHGEDLWRTSTLARRAMAHPVDRGRGDLLSPRSARGTAVYRPP